MGQTAIDWFHEKMTYVRWLRERDEISREKADEMSLEFRNDANVMFFEQIMDANKSGVDSATSGNWESGRSYFKRKYMK
jgi:hypothetical protein